MHARVRGAVVRPEAGHQVQEEDGGADELDHRDLGEREPRQVVKFGQYARALHHTEDLEHPKEAQHAIEAQHARLGSGLPELLDDVERQHGDEINHEPGAQICADDRAGCASVRKAPQQVRGQRAQGIAKAPGCGTHSASESA